MVLKSSVYIAWLHLASSCLTGPLEVWTYELVVLKSSIHILAMPYQQRSYWASGPMSIMELIEVFKMDVKHGDRQR